MRKTTKFSDLILFSLSLVVLTGCGEKPATESVINISHLKNLEVESLVKLRDISDGDWDYVCVLTPYAYMVRPVLQEKIRCLTKRIMHPYIRPWDEV